MRTELQERVLLPVACSGKNPNQSEHDRGRSFRRMAVLVCGWACFAMLVRPAAAGADFRFTETNLLSDAAAADRWIARGGQLRSVTGGIEAETNSREPAVFSLPVHLEKDVEYFFSARVRSADQVAFLLDDVKMAYHQQGRDQVVCGLIRCASNGPRNLQMLVAPLEGDGPASAWIENLILQPVERPTMVVSRPRNGRTVLAENGKPEAAIVYPSGSDQYRHLAGQVQEAVRKWCGVELPMVPDSEACVEKYPVLKPAYANRNLILLGRIGNNRALWPAYNRYLAAEDGYYPGGDGLVIRTAADVMKNGRNHLILGGSSEKGVERAVEVFCGLLGRMIPSDGGQASLPWTLKVELGGECREAFVRDNEKWRKGTDEWLPALTSGYGKVARWYGNAMGYYWSGESEYLERAKEYLRQLLSERAYTHHYLVEFFIRTYDMLDDSPVFSEEEINQLDGLILENFLDASAVEASWMTVFSPPYRAIKIVNRHQIAPWFADLNMARFLLHHVELSGALEDLVAFRASEKQAAFAGFVAERNGLSLPGLGGPATEWEEIPATFFRFALEEGLYEDFVSSGLAHQALALERLDHNSGVFAPPGGPTDLLPVWLGALAQITGDARYEWLRRNLPFTTDGRPPFQGRYVAGVHRYTPDPAAPAEKPDGTWAGIHVAPQPHRFDQDPRTTATRFPFLSFRGSFDAGDDFVGVAGINAVKPTGTLVTATIGGFPLITAGGPTDAGRALSNGASAIRLTGYKIGRVAQDETASPSEVRWKVERPDLWAAEVETAISPEMNWKRTILRLGKGAFVFCDTFAAVQPGRYLLRIGWWPNVPPVVAGGRWRIGTNLGSVSMWIRGEGFDVRQRDRALVAESVRTMEAGAQATVWTLVQNDYVNPPWTAQEQSPGQIEVARDGGGSWVFRRGPLETSSGSLSADLFAWSPQSLEILGVPGGEDGSLVNVHFSRESGHGTLEVAGRSMPWTALQEALRAPEKSPVVAEAGSEIFPADETGAWKEIWAYDGLRKPAEVTAVRVQEDVVDFGRVVDLAEVRSVYRGRTYEVTKVPREIFIAPPDAVAPPASDSTDWKPLRGRWQTRPQPRTGNYGETLPMKEGDESLLVQGIRTRFLKAPGAEGLVYFTNDEMKARHPVRLELMSDVPGLGFPVVRAASDLFPAFPRKDREDDFSLALLNTDTGKPVCQIDVLGPVQGARIADQKGSGKAEIFVLKADAKIETYSLEGKPGAEIDLYSQFAGFQKEFGKENTRIPAGGHYMPFSFGFWRPETDGALKLVIGRYGSLAFLDADRRLEGVLNFPSYAASAMLSRGRDFNGDGIEEMLVMEMTRMVHVGGDAQSEIKDDNEQYWPQVYRLEAVTYAKDSETSFLSGAPIHLFEPLESFGGSGRLVLVARENYIGLYDAVDRAWKFSWRPPASISGAAVTRQTPDEMDVLLSTKDGLLWSLHWTGTRLSRPRVDVAPTVLDIQQIRPAPGTPGWALLSTKKGLFQQGPEPADLVKVAGGSFQSAVEIAPGRIAAVDDTGSVRCFQRNSSIETAARLLEHH